MNPFATPGAISWSELQTSDRDAAVSFYSSVFGRMCVVQDPQGAVFELISYDESFLTEKTTSVDFARCFATHGLFSWFELRTKNVQAASEFYSSLFGWEITTEQMSMGPYSIIKVDGVGIGGILNPPGLETPNHWGGYVTVDDADQIADKVRSAGGIIVAGPVDLPSVGRMVMFLDPQGASLACLAYLPMKGVTI